MTLKELVNKKEEIEKQIESLMEPVRLAQEEAKEIDSQIDAIILEPIKQARLLSGKDTGTVDVLVQGIMVKHQTTKRVVWDQEKLSALRERIAQHNDDPDVYMKAKTTYSVDEKAWSQFPPQIKSVFSEAREVKASAPKITFDLNWRA